MFGIVAHTKTNKGDDMKTYGLILSLLFLIANAAVASAQEQAYRTTTTTSTMDVRPDYPMELSFQGGALWPQKSTDRFEMSPSMIARLTYDVSPTLAVGVESGGMQFKDEVNGTKFGHLNGIPIMGTIVMKVPMESMPSSIVPYIFASGGVIMWSYDESNVLKNTDIRIKSRNRLAFKSGVGVDFYVAPNVALFVEGAYLFSPTFHLKANNAGSSAVTGKVDPSSAYAGAGIKFAF